MAYGNLVAPIRFFIPPCASDRLAKRFLMALRRFLLIIVRMGTIKTDKRPLEDRKVARPLAHPAERAIAQLGADFSRARRRRSITQANLAQRAGVSLSTIKRLEAGDPRMQLHVLARVLLVFGELGKLKALLDSAGDDIGLALADEGLPQRVRARKGQNAF